MSLCLKDVQLVPVLLTVILLFLSINSHTAQRLFLELWRFPFLAMGKCNYFADKVAKMKHLTRLFSLIQLCTYVASVRKIGYTGQGVNFFNWLRLFYCHNKHQKQDPCNDFIAQEDWLLVVWTWSSFCDRAVHLARSIVWNYLPTELKQPGLSYSRLRHSVKTLLFGHWTKAQCESPI